MCYSFVPNIYAPLVYLNEDFQSLPLSLCCHIHSFSSLNLCEGPALWKVWVCLIREDLVCSEVRKLKVLSVCLLIHMLGGRKYSNHTQPRQVQGCWLVVCLIDHFHSHQCSFLSSFSLSVFGLCWIETTIVRFWFCAYYNIRSSSVIFRNFEICDLLGPVSLKSWDPDVGCKVWCVVGCSDTCTEDGCFWVVEIRILTTLATRAMPESVFLARRRTDQFASYSQAQFCQNSQGQLIVS